MSKNGLNCRVCPGKCNKKGFPSVSKLSYYCNEQRKTVPITQAWGFAKYWNKMLNLKSFIGTKLRGFR
ncbi:MAG: hypothetical protein BV457_01555 [Thermoplasmata archaeon M9B1D]|nr:MAG: hypothetical protein BV457_01555 [Thermoplasmata archaeon M9B1D]